jgi:N-acetylneuraminate synthase/N,N'-diacetyllegionaminate synthase
MKLKPINMLCIGDKQIGPDQPAFFIAEAGVNHNGNVENAKRLVEIAADAGADAVKFQTFRAEELASSTAPKAKYQKDHSGADESQFEMLKRLELSAENFQEIEKHARLKGIIFLSTPFDTESVDMLDHLGMPAFKIPSGEITNWPLLEHIAAKHEPVILSTGMSYLSEVEEAIGVLRVAGCSQLAILHCTSNYPATAASSNLRAMQTIFETFGVPTGLSDHTLGMEMAIAAVAMGARIIEKHFTLDKSLPGPDHQASLAPDELRSLIHSIREVESGMGDGVKRPTPSEEETRDVARRSIIARQEILKGTTIERQMLVFKRPGNGIPPSKLVEIVGRKVTRTIPADSKLEFEDLS